MMTSVILTLMKLIKNDSTGKIYYLEMSSDNDMVIIYYATMYIFTITTAYLMVLTCFCNWMTDDEMGGYIDDLPIPTHNKLSIGK